MGTSTPERPDARTAPWLHGERMFAILSWVTNYPFPGETPYHWGAEFLDRGDPDLAAWRGWGALGTLPHASCMVRKSPTTDLSHG